MNKSKLFSVSLLLLILFSFFSCATTAVTTTDIPLEETQLLTISELCPSELVWTEIEPGISQTSYKVKKLGIDWYCIKIDLTNPSLKIQSEITKTKKGFRINQPARKAGAVVTINTTPFDVNNYLNVVGIVKNEGTTLSQPVNSYCALGFNSTEKGYEAVILKNQVPEQIERLDSAYGGFFQILHNNEIDYNFQNIRRSRCGCGISAGKTELYLLVSTAGLAFKDRNGLTYPECAMIFQNMGCTEAMEFDGGHSTGLCIYNRQVLKPWFQRKVPAVLEFITLPRK